MVAVADFRSTVPVTHDDIRGLRPFLFQLLGEPFLFARESYGGELTLHFGREVTLPQFRGRETTEGTHVLTLRASVWYIKSSPWSALIMSDDVTEWPHFKPTDLKELEGRPPIAAGGRVTWIGVRAFHGEGWPGGIELGMQFSDDSFIEIRPRRDPEDDVYDLADWELVTPYKRYIKAGPGVRWEYSASDKPPAKKRKRGKA